MKLFTARKWFYSASILLIALALVYVFLHIFRPGSDYEKLSQQEITNVNQLLFFNASPPTDHVNKSADTTACAKSLDLLKKELAEIKDSAVSAAKRKKLVYDYVFQLHPPLDTSVRSEYTRYLNSLPLKDFSFIISSMPIRARSYFWLSDNWILLEVIFWSLFGLMASLFYHTSEAVRTNTFNTKELTVHLAKLFYAPICTIAIYLSLNLLTSSNNAVVDDHSPGVIVFAFILGFFSGRMIDLLNKLKDIILPLGKSADDDKESANPSPQNISMEDLDKIFKDFYPKLQALDGVHSIVKGLVKNDAGEETLGIRLKVKKDSLEKIQEWLKTNTPKIGEQTVPVEVIADDDVTSVHNGNTRLQASSKIRNASNSVAKTGTLSAFFRKATDTNIYALSCYHVLRAGNQAWTRFSAEAGSPAMLYSVPGGADVPVGNVVDGLRDNETDAGIFMVSSDFAPENTIPLTASITSFRDITNDDLGKQVRFFGTESGYAEAKITALFASTKIDYQDNAPPYSLENLFCISKNNFPVSVGGDSGAAVVDSDGNALGIIVGADHYCTFVLRIMPIMRKLNIPKLL